MTDKDVRTLCAGIVKQAITDYIWILNNEGKTKGGWSRVGLERYFRSPEFRAISDLDGEWLIRFCRKEKDSWQKRRGLNVGSASFLLDRGHM